MKESFLEDFENEVKNIRLYLEHIETVDDLVIKNKSVKTQNLNNFKEHMQNFKLSKKLFEYKSIIISLYGLLENTISQWIQEHINNVSKIVSNYEQLDTKFKDNHFMLSIKLISLIMEGKNSKYEEINKEDILKKLYTSISTQSAELNSEAYIPISGNLKHSKIIDAFKPLQINDLDSKLSSEKFKIDDLVNRRNEIGHGSKIDEILDISMYLDYTDSLKKYMAVIFEAISEKELEYKSIHQYQQIQTIHKILKNSILCFELQNNSLKKGDFIIIKSAENVFFKRTIIDIQINKKSVDNAQTNNKLDIGIDLGVGKQIKANQTFYIKKANQWT